VVSSNPTVVRKLCGHVSGGPRGVVDQSKARMRAPISPPAARKLSGGIGKVSVTLSSLLAPSSLINVNRVSVVYDVQGNYTARLPGSYSLPHSSLSP